MNSMTPVTSLAHSAVALMRGVDKGGDADIADARTAVETLARRADGVMHFVESYRQISRAPEIRSRPIDVAAWGREIEALFRASERAVGIEFTLEVDETLTLEADPDLMSQVLINLIRNAGQAALGHAEAPQVWLTMARTRSGRTQIEVGDNGPGIPESLRQDIFLPFFTTKQEGTGVGLSLARQVDLAHKGAISVGERKGGGALFRIVV
jgi:signal transduction histidine kinase